MPRRHRVVLFFALVAALSLVGAACSDNGVDLAAKNPKAAMAAASKRTVNAKTVRLALSAKTQTGVSVVSGRGAYEFGGKRGRFTLSTASGTGVDVIITPATMYVKVPNTTADGKPYVSLTDADLATAAASTNAPTVQLAQLLNQTRSQVDPRSTLDALGENVPRLKRVGAQKIRGAATTHFTGRVDLSDKALAAAPESKKAALQAARNTFGPDGYPVEVWLDNDGRVRRVQYALVSGTGAQQTSTTVRLDLYGFGDDSGIVIPNAADVGDGAALLNPTTTTAPK